MHTGTIPLAFADRLALLRATVVTAYEQYPDQIPQYAQIESTNELFQNWLLVSSLGLFKARGELVNAQLDEMREVASKKLTPTGQALAIQQSEESIRKDTLNLFDQKNKLLGDSAMESKNILFADLFERGDTLANESHYSADGANWFDAAHPIDGGASSDSNLLTAGDISPTTIQAMMTAGDRTVNDRGIQINLDVKEFVVPTEQSFLMSQMMESTADPETADGGGGRATPFVHRGFRYSVMNKLTNTTAWYGRDPNFVNKVPTVIWLNGKDLELDFDTNVLNQSMLVVATMEFTYGVVEWRGWLKNPYA
jgi:hypothetical protein